MTTSSDFRQDVQGLRGIAVSLVVLEHATPFLSGGFVGVDVFFVISGFVITRLLVAEQTDTQKISLSAFYSRRIRRLIPALTVVLVATLALSVIVLSPGLEQDKAVAAALSSFFFVANLRYVLEGGYFFLQADPLRHLWSLGVEEQFYAFYPVLVIAVVAIAKRLRISWRRSLVFVMVVISALSLASAAVLALGRGLPLATRLSFFGTPFRLWELMAGGLVALWSGRVPQFVGRRSAQVLAVIGFGLILWPSVTYGPFTPFPGLAVVPPVLGTVMLIVSGSGPDAPATPLAWRPAVLLGDISYGLYLWHWPLIVFSNRLFPQHAIAPLAAVVIAVLISVFQYRSIELPIRQRSDWRGMRAVRVLAAAAAISVTTAILVSLASRSGLGLEVESSFERLDFAAAECSLVDGALAADESCSADIDNDHRLMLVGDSQAAALSDGFVEVAEALNAGYLMAFGNSCPVHLRPNEIRDDCQRIQNATRDLVDSFDPDVLVIANASDLYVSRGGFGKPDTQIRMKNGRLPANYQEALGNWTSGVVGALATEPFSERTIVYVQMVPVAPVRTPTLLQREVRVEKFALSESFDRNLIVEAERDAMAQIKSLKVLDPASVLCISGQCTLIDKGEPIYADLYHLNPRGAKLLVNELSRMISELKS
jgi:peptidoglycan/LPS O-acetylase OafA/YrhL